jgi:hypothetical protein
MDPREIDMAGEWLSRMLVRPMMSADIIGMALECGFTESTLLRAARVLRVKFIRLRSEKISTFGPLPAPGRVEWSLSKEERR